MKTTAEIRAEIGTEPKELEHYVERQIEVDGLEAFEAAVFELWATDSTLAMALNAAKARVGRRLAA